METVMPIARKTFLSTTMLTAAALAACTGERKAALGNPEAEFFRVLRHDEYDYDAMMAIIRNPNPHKQVFVSSALPVPSEGLSHQQRAARAGVAAIFGHMQLAMNGYDFSLGPDHGTLATLGVLTGNAVILGLDDAMWSKYGIGQHFGLDRTNVCYRATSNLDPTASPNDPAGMYQDWSAQAVLKRGGSFTVCHNALTNVASALTGGSSIGLDGVLAELGTHLLPGFMLVPAGITVVQLAQEHGWKPYVT